MSEPFLTEADLATFKGSANEANWDAFVKSVGGEKISDLHPNATFENADYLFRERKVVVELKILETEFGNTEQFREKLRIFSERSFQKWGKSPLSLDSAVTGDYLKGFLELFRSPLARIAKKANRQIRSTKENISLEDHLGVWLLVNDNFRELPPTLMLGTLGRILNGSCSSIDAVIYLTNHYIVIPGDEYGRVLWAPLYSPSAPDGLQEFVNWLGREWFDFAETLGDPSDDRLEAETFSLAGSRAAGSKFPIS